MLGIIWPGHLGCTTKPRCTSLDTAGSFDGDTFVPDSGCFFGVPSAADTREILTGSWLFVAGGSNLWATVMNLGNQLEPGAFAWRDDFDNVPRYVDLIWERTAATDGSAELRRLHWVYQKYIVKYTNGGDDRAALDAAQFNASLPAYATDRVRLTFYHGCKRSTTPQQQTAPPPSAPRSGTSSAQPSSPTLL